MSIEFQESQIIQTLSIHFFFKEAATMWQIIVSEMDTTMKQKNICPTQGIPSSWGKVWQNKLVNYVMSNRNQS